MKYIIVDSRISSHSKAQLQNFGEIIELPCSVSVYEEIGGHPDIFVFQDKNSLIVAPNAPVKFLNELNSAKINFTLGSKKLGSEYPDTALYNAVSTQNMFIHNLKITDESILEFSTNKLKIHVNQGYTRCNLLPLNNRAFISSDRGICRELERKKMKTLYINPENIILHGMKHGFFGGCCGVSDHFLFINGAVDFLHEKNEFFDFVLNEGFHIVELNDGPLTDVGSILVVETNTLHHNSIE